MRKTCHGLILTLSVVFSCMGEDSDMNYLKCQAMFQAATGADNPKHVIRFCRDILAKGLE